MQLRLSGCVNPIQQVLSTKKFVVGTCDDYVDVVVTARAYNCGTILQCPIHISYQIGGTDVLRFDVPCGQTVTQRVSIPCNHAVSKWHALNAWSNPGCIACVDATADVPIQPPSLSPLLLAVVAIGIVALIVSLRHK